MTDKIQIKFSAVDPVLKTSLKALPGSYDKTETFKSIFDSIDETRPLVLQDDDDHIIPLFYTVERFSQKYPDTSTLGILIGKPYLFMILPDNDFKQINLESATVSEIINCLPELFPEDKYGLKNGFALKPVNQSFIYNTDNKMIQGKWEESDEAIQIEVVKPSELIKFSYDNYIFYIDSKNDLTYQDIRNDFDSEFEISDIIIVEENTNKVINAFENIVDPNKSYIIYRANAEIPIKETPDSTNVTDTKKLDSSSSHSSDKPRNSINRTQTYRPSPKSQSDSKNSKSKAIYTSQIPNAKDRGSTKLQKRVEEPKPKNGTSKYSFKFYQNTKTFEMEVQHGDTVEDVISKIERKNQVENIGLFHGPKDKEELLHSEDMFCESVEDNEIITIKQLLSFTVIHDDGSSKTKHLNGDITVLELKTYYKSRYNKEVLIYDKDDNELEDSKIIKDIPDLTYKVHTPNPRYTFEIDNTYTNEKATEQIEIPDYTNPEKCKQILKSKIPKLQEYNDSQITIDINFNDEFGSQIQTSQTIQVRIGDPEYFWLTYSTTTEKGKDKYEITNLSFPTDYTIQDVITDFENKFPDYSFVVIHENKEIDRSLNLFENKLYDQTLTIQRHEKTYKCTITLNNATDPCFTFTAKPNWPLGIVAQFLSFSNSLSFNKTALKHEPQYPIPECDWHNRLSFTYIDKTYTKDNTFKDLNITNDDEDVINISLKPPMIKFSTLFKTSEYETLEEFVNSNTDKHYEMFNNLLSIDPTEDDSTNFNAIQCISYKHKVEFEFDPKRSIPNYPIYVNDENMSIKEMKAMISAYLFEQGYHCQLSQIELFYNGSKLENISYKDIGYNESEKIHVEINRPKVRIDYGDGTFEDIDVDENQTLNDFATTNNLALHDSSYAFESCMFNFLYKPLRGIKRNRILIVNGVPYSVDKYKNQQQLEKYIQQDLGIDLSKAELTSGGKSVTLKKIVSSPAIEVNVKPGESNIENIFKDKKYNGRFYSNQSIKEVRDFIKTKEKIDSNQPLILKSGDKYLTNNQRLFQIDSHGQITFEKCTKAIKFIITNLYPPSESGSIKKIEAFMPLDFTCQDLYDFAKALRQIDFPLFQSGGNDIPKDDSLLMEYGTEFEACSSNEEKITFLDKNRKVRGSSIYTSSMKIGDYKTKLKLPLSSLFIIEGKLFDDNYDTLNILDDVDPANRQVIVLDKNAIYYNELEDELFQSAACAKLFEKPVLKISEVKVVNIDTDETDTYKVDPDKEITIGDLKQKISKKKRQPIQSIALYILFTSVSTEYAVLRDTESVSVILNKFSDQNISMRILEPPKKAPSTRFVERQAKALGITLSPDEMMSIAVQSQNKPLIIQSTLEYYKQE